MDLPKVPEDQPVSVEKMKTKTVPLLSATSSGSPTLDEDTKSGELPYIAMFSVHGLIRGEAPELGKDLDTGGQVTYVLEVARKLSGMAQVDLFTRLIDDSTVADDYKNPCEVLAPGVNLVRIPCGPGRYIRKELLWQFFPEFIDRTLEFMRKNRPKPMAVHGHYADGMLIACILSDILAVPFVSTGHSMGRTKLRSCLKKMKYPAIQSKFKIDMRIEAEERSLQSCNLLIANSTEEINTQWRLLYDGFHAFESMFQPIALKPGVGMKRFIWKYPGYESGAIPPNPSDCFREKHFPKIWKTIDRFFDDPDKPVVLLLARPAPEKNLITMVECFGESEELRAACNLVLIAGQRTDIDSMAKEQREVLESILKLIDKYDLYGTVSYPKHHSRSDVPAMFALPAYRGGVFANIALREPFGLTLIEAAVNGAPILATTNGAGTEIVEKLQNGIAVKPTDKKAICDAVLKLVKDKEYWKNCHLNSLKNSHIYSWDGHVSQYMSMVRSLTDEMPEIYPRLSPFKVPLIRERNEILVVCDIDNTLIHPSVEGIAAFRKFVQMFRANKDRMRLALATGRSINSCIEYVSSFDPKLVSECSFLITSVGCEIHYWKTLKFEGSKKLAAKFGSGSRGSSDGGTGDSDASSSASAFSMTRLCSDAQYQSHLSYRFSRNELAAFIKSNFPDLELQSEKSGHSPLEQRAYKLSYVLNTDHDLTDDDGFTNGGGSGTSSSPSSPTVTSYADDSDESDSDLSGVERRHSSNDGDEEASSTGSQLLRAPSAIDLQRVGSSDSLYSMTRPISSHGLSKLGLKSGFGWGSLLRLSAAGSTSSLSGLGSAGGGPSSATAISLAGTIGDRLLSAKDYERENGSLNKYLHGSDLQRQLKGMLRKQGFVCDVIVSHDKFVDILPIRASKGKALRYLLNRNDWDFDRVVVCGDSGNDLDMLSGMFQAIVVGNYASELSTLSYSQQVYFAKNFYADGVIEGIKNYFPSFA